VLLISLAKFTGYAMALFYKFVKILSTETKSISRQPSKGWEKILILNYRQSIMIFNGFQ
jgi:hypothetical protein